VAKGLGGIGLEYFEHTRRKDVEDDSYVFLFMTSSIGADEPSITHLRVALAVDSLVMAWMIGRLGPWRRNEVRGTSRSTGGFAGDDYV